MESFSLGELARALQLACPGTPGLQLGGVSTDTRSLRPGDVFFALAGERYRGNQFIEEAFSKGARAAVVPQSCPELRPRRLLLRVASVRRALMDFARWYREELDFRVVGITGSAGKTTTKDLLHHMLKGLVSTVKAPRSFNNEVGLSLSLLSADRHTRVAVVELGTSAPGEISALAQVAQPDLGIITCIGQAHLEGLGGIEGVAREKLSLLEHLRPGGGVVLNGDDLRLRGSASALTTVRGPEAVDLVGFGGSDSLGAFGLTWWGLPLERSWSWSLATYCRDRPGPLLELPAPGHAFALDAMLALAAGARLGFAPWRLAESLLSFRPAKGRLTATRAGAVRLLDDTYNANPTSVGASLETFAGLTPPEQRVVVLGGMKELGAAASAHHRRVGRQIAQLGVHTLVVVGEDAQAIARGARAAGLSGSRVRVVAQPEDVGGLLASSLTPGQTVLFKASRACGLEAAVEAVREQLEDRAEDETVAA